MSGPGPSWVSRTKICLTLKPPESLLRSETTPHPGTELPAQAKGELSWEQQEPLGQVVMSPLGSMECWSGAWVLLLALEVLGIANGQPVALACHRLGPRGDMNCSWAGPAPHNASGPYHLHYRGLKLLPGASQSAPFPPRQRWVLVERSHLTQNEVYDVWVEADDGTNVTWTLRLDLDAIVKPPPPRLSLVNMSSGVAVTWETEGSLPATPPPACELRYRLCGASNWTSVPEDDLEPSGHEFLGLEPFTAYEAQARCGPPWSDWGAPLYFTTPEAAPEGLVDVWRVLNDTEPGRPCLLLWKELDPKLARGVVTSYNVAIPPAPDQAVPCCHARLPCTAPNASISASTHRGRTKPAILSLERTDLPPPQKVQAEAVSGGGLAVSWVAPGVEPRELLVEWAEEMGDPRTLPNWTRCPLEHNHILLPGKFQPEVPYQVRMYALYPRGFGAAPSIRVYVQEGVPSAGPEGLHAQSVSPTASVISWHEIPLRYCHGKLVNYTLYLESATGSLNTNQSVNASERSYWLSGLQPDTAYYLRMSGSTNVGEGPTSAVYVFHTPSSHWQTILGALFGLGLFFLLACIAGIIFRAQLLTLCHKVLPRWCWEKIPDPVHSLVLLQEVPKDTGSLVFSLAPKEPPITHIAIEAPASPNIKTPPSPGPSSSPGDPPPILSGYEKHFMPTPEEVMGLV
ncbi:interleukin-27 receptor subunit alpha isoform X1 [Alligator mississippiensis]|uniref:interleukin-27 receptor subunit alpha isoform X1 n=1 Tax=Alligator mississippiensis TaxID=8496 RepID=UPI002877D757|nr:interleukin-27 receptor subunit alpha isoform X1 [Alligator mississippiensis]